MFDRPLVMKLKQASMFQGDPSSNCFIIKFRGVLTCDILGIGLLQVQYLFYTIICSSVKMKKSHKINLMLVTHTSMYA